MLWRILQLFRHPVPREMALVLAAFLVVGKLKFNSFLPSLAAFGLYTLIPLQFSLYNIRTMQQHRAQAKLLASQEPLAKPWAELTAECTPTQERYVVIGGLGFVGKRIVHALVLRGERNVLVVDLDSKAMVHMQALYPSVEFKLADVTQFDDIASTLVGADCVFAPFAVIRYWESLTKHLNRSWAVNVDGVRNVCEACVLHKVKRLIVTSSSAVAEPFPSVLSNGLNEDSPKVNQINATSNYCYSKSVGETIALSYHSPTGLQVSSIRPCTTVFGHGDKLALSNIERGFYPVMDANNAIDYVHVDSVVLAHLLCERKLRDDGNLAGGEAFCVNTQAVEDGVFASLVETYFCTPQRKVKLVVLPGRLIFLLSLGLSLIQYLYPGDVFDLLGKDLGMLTLPTFLTATKRVLLTSNAKAERVLGYQPHKPIAQAVQQTMQEVAEDRVIMQ
ncbi:hypothetical protein BASA81_004752 [Batrachochytrium salamandrivorans]|nr:hypothetical protein BASA81_004752 [Batrachochytrium salamandrivorans]